MNFKLMSIFFYHKSGINSCHKSALQISIFGSFFRKTILIYDIINLQINYMKGNNFMDINEMLQRIKDPNAVKDIAKNNNIMYQYMPT